MVHHPNNKEVPSVLMKVLFTEGEVHQAAGDHKDTYRAIY